ncbi:28S ribosomal protein S18c, mitochondrial [Contarinia nasturtii]|uniref:28S ribosomal protein S18c, mitochondrial n=1 Tax=Contarinia nasturtii TaxID=265458 RepID=UPI0012D4546A|nr:28S ribosomal protein S18c, mitochondrial [Contarinia nasturtii]
MSIQLVRNIFRQGYIQRVLNTTNSIAKYSSQLPSGDEVIDDAEPINIKNPYKRENRQCLLCKLNLTPDYKNVRLLSQFQSMYTGRIYGRHITGLCKTKQQQVEHAIRRSHQVGFMPRYHKYPEYNNDPKLYDPEKPIRPHPY